MVMVKDRMKEIKKSKVVNMTQGNPTKLILWFAFPMLIGNLFQQLYNMVDCVIVGRYVSADALGAVGATGSLNFLFFSVSMGVSTGIGIVTAQFFGANNEEDVKRTIANSIYVVGTIGIIMSVIGAVFAKPILQMMNTPAVYIEDSIRYMRITCGCSLAVIGYNTISALLRALGDSKTPLYFLVMASIMNIGLDLLFVIQFNMGVEGVAYATVIAQACSAIGAIIYALLTNPYFKIGKELRKPNKRIISRSIRVGIPIAFQSSMIAVSCIVLQRVVNGFGPIVGTANTALMKIEQLVQQPFASLSTALATYTGQNLGAGKITRVKKGFTVGFFTVVVFSAIMLVVGQVFGKEIIGIFVTDGEVISFGERAFKITSCLYVMLGLIYITRGVLNGMGDNAFALINGTTELGCRVFLSKPLTMIPFIGVWGIWITTGATWFITGAVNFWRYMVVMRKYRKLDQSA